MVCPRGWVCQAVRAPGVKWTLAAPRRDGSVGVATVSRYTVPVNHSLGPVAVSVVFLVICMSFSFSVGTAGARRSLFGEKLVGRGAMSAYRFLRSGLPPSAAMRRQLNGGWCD